MRVRPDGTRTYTTPEWDARWYWPVGTRVRVGDVGSGVVIKSNTVTVNVLMDAGGIRSRVSVEVLTRNGQTNL
jgi:hypothetical protein